MKSVKFILLFCIVLCVSANGAEGYLDWVKSGLKESHGVDAGVVESMSGDLAVEGLRVIGPAANRGKLDIIDDAQGQRFGRHVRVETLSVAGENWHTMGQILSRELIEKGSYLFTFFAKGRVPGIAGREAVSVASVKRRSQGNTFARLSVNVGDSWVRYFMPFESKEAIASEDLEVIFSLAFQEQQIELGGFALLNCGSTPLDRLPGLAPAKMDYSGREPDAQWRKDALERIENIRKGNMAVRVVDAQGKPVEGAQVRFQMRRHGFRWGTACVPTYTFLDTRNPLTALEREKILEHFNHITVDVELKAGTYLKFDDAKKKLLTDVLSIVRDKGLTIRGHTFVWPGFRTNEHWRHLAGDPAALGKAVDDFIIDSGKLVAPYVIAYDVINEPVGDREIISILGDDRPAHWFKLARKVLGPEVTLWLNEAGMTSNDNGRDNIRQKIIIDMANDLIARKAPIYGIGDQAHFNTPTDPENVMKVWDELASTGLKLAVTEFDVSFGADQELEADYIRDFTILAFSHPAMEEFTMWGIIDELHWKKNAPLYSGKGGKLELKPGGKQWLDLVFKQWWTDENAVTNSRGVASAKGFLGSYDICVEHGGKSKTVHATIPGDAQKLVIILD